MDFNVLFSDCGLRRPWAGNPVGNLLDGRAHSFVGGALMLSQTVEYALRAATFLALTPEEPRTAEQIAEATRVPVAYLAKVMQSLARGGIVTSRRGVGGGFMLVLPPRDLPILQIVQAVDPIQRITFCPLGLASHGTHLCPLHRRLDQALEAMEKAFSTTTLAEVLAEPSPSVPLCGFPVVGAVPR
jgi:Rrf2 family protein